MWEKRTHIKHILIHSYSHRHIHTKVYPFDKFFIIRSAYIFVIRTPKQEQRLRSLRRTSAYSRDGT